MTELHNKVFQMENNIYTERESTNCTYNCHKKLPYSRLASKNTN